jgi:hypothetical protein
MSKPYAFAATLITLSLLTAAVARAETAPAQPCPGVLVTPVNLDPRGDNYLSVLRNPAARPEIDELFTGDVVCALNRSGAWVHVQYTRDGRGFTGWAHSRYLSKATAAPAASSGGGNTTVNQQQLQQKQIIIDIHPNVSQ